MGFFSFLLCPLFEIFFGIARPLALTFGVPAEDLDEFAGAFRESIGC